MKRFPTSCNSLWLLATLCPRRRPALYPTGSGQLVRRLRISVRSSSRYNPLLLSNICRIQGVYPGVYPCIVCLHTRTHFLETIKIEIWRAVKFLSLFNETRTHTLTFFVIKKYFKSLWQAVISCAVPSDEIAIFGFQDKEKLTWPHLRCSYYTILVNLMKVYLGFYAGGLGPRLF